MTQLVRDTPSPRQIRVLQLGSSTGLYGAERWILALVKHFQVAQIESTVSVIQDTPGPTPALCAQAARSGIPTQVFESHGKLSLSAIGQLRRFIRGHGIDILHTHGYKTDIIGYLAALGTDCKIIATPHGWGKDAGAKLQLYEALDRFVFRFLDAVVPLSADLYEGLSRSPGVAKRLRMIRNGVDLSEVDTTTEPSPELLGWKAPGGVVIGYIGQLIPRKGIDTLIRAFHRLDIPHRHLCIVGSGPQRAELERLAAELGEQHRTHFFGYRDDRIALLKGFDVFVLPSALEGIPRSAMEAMAAGIPVIATDIPGCRDLIEAGVSGLLFDVGDDVGLARHIERIAADELLRASLGLGGRRLVNARYSAAAMAEAYADLYQRLVEREARGDTSPRAAE